MDFNDFAKQRRGEFPIFAKYPELSYLDSGATAQKPQVVIDALKRFWQEENAPLHRGVYKLSADATMAFEDVRSKVAKFINASKAEEIIFVRGTTDGMNLLTHSFLRPRLEAGDNVVATEMEHHANFLPWQQCCIEKGAEFRLIPLKKSEGSQFPDELDLEATEALLDEKTKLLTFNHASNVLGTVNPVKQLIALARKKGIPVVLDGAQAVVHLSVDVQELDCDFYVFSSHKLYGPDGIGVVYGRNQLLQAMPPYQTGGNMIEFVTQQSSTFAPSPQRFEAGTMPASAVIGLGAALDYLSSFSWQDIEGHEAGLLEYCHSQLEQLPFLKITGHAKHKLGVVSFQVEGVHPHDVGTILDKQNVAVRAGHHCAQPLMSALGLPATTRASFGIYNTREDIDQLYKGLLKVGEIML